METFEVRYFRGDDLETVETMQAPDLLEVIDRTRPEREVIAEIWSKIGKVGMIGPVPATLSERAARASQEAQITKVMKCRLQLVRE